MLTVALFGGQDAWVDEHGMGTFYDISSTDATTLYYSGTYCGDDEQYQQDIELDAGEYIWRVGAAITVSEDQIAWDFCDVFGGALSILAFTVTSDGGCVPLNLVSMSSVTSSSSSSISSLAAKVNLGDPDVANVMVTDSGEVAAAAGQDKSLVTLEGVIQLNGGLEMHDMTPAEMDILQWTLANEIFMTGATGGTGNTNVAGTLKNAFSGSKLSPLSKLSFVSIENTVSNLIQREGRLLEEQESQLQEIIKEFGMKTSLTTSTSAAIVSSSAAAMKMKFQTKINLDRYHLHKADHTNINSLVQNLKVYLISSLVKFESKLFLTKLYANGHASAVGNLHHLHSIKSVQLLDLSIIDYGGHHGVNGLSNSMSNNMIVEIILSNIYLIILALVMLVTAGFVWLVLVKMSNDPGPGGVTNGEVSNGTIIADATHDVESRYQLDAVDSSVTSVSSNSAMIPSRLTMNIIHEHKLQPGLDVLAE